MAAGTTLLQRKNAGKLLAPLVNSLFPHGRQSDGVEFVCTAQQITDLVNALSAAPVVTTQAGATYRADVNDAFTIIEFIGGTAHAFSLPTDAQAPSMGLGSIIAVVQVGAGALTWPPGIVGGTPTVVGGVTYNVPTPILTPVRLATYTWRKRAASEWILA